MINRFEIQNKLFPTLGNYWGERIVTQITYLEEINAVNNGQFDALLNEATDLLNQS